MHVNFQICRKHGNANRLVQMQLKLHLMVPSLQSSIKELGGDVDSPERAVVECEQQLRNMQGAPDVEVMAPAHPQITTWPPWTTATRGARAPCWDCMSTSPASSQVLFSTVPIVTALLLSCYM